jgi:hypothetical protein
MLNSSGFLGAGPSRDEASEAKNDFGTLLPDPSLKAKTAFRTCKVVAQKSALRARKNIRDDCRLCFSV